MKRKGFTLVELLAVIVILALVALITIPVILNVIEKSKQKTYQRSIDAYGRAVNKAIAEYLLDNEKDTSKTLTYEDIKDYIKYEGNKVECDTFEIYNDKTIYLAECKVNNESISYTYGTFSLPKPYLGKELTPVIYDGVNWKVVDANDTNWYDYENQKWANAVLLGSDDSGNRIIKNPGDIVTLDGTEVKMMLTWIPRYEYKIEGEYGKNGKNKTMPGEIEINFISKEKTISHDGYKIHPAFLFGDKQLSGIWVGKFELSHMTKSKGNRSWDNVAALNCDNNNCLDSINLRVLPNLPSLRYNTVSNFYYIMKSVENIFNISRFDTHMIKNSEWAAAAYLSQSRYGKYGNNDYDGINKEVYQNKSSNFITGSSNGTISTSTTNSQCNYDDITKQELGKGQCGPGASTTGNIYGIYDMSGGSWEYVMGVYAPLDSPIISSSGFTTTSLGQNGLIDLKYYDMYTIDNLDCGEMCYGHAIFETKEWYSDKSLMINSSSPWVVRGGRYSDNTNSGIFYLDVHNGTTGYSRSSRIVFVEN